MHNLIMVERIVDQLLGRLPSVLVQLVVRQLTLGTLLLGKELLALQGLLSCLCRVLEWAQSVLHRVLLL